MIKLDVCAKENCEAKHHKKAVNSFQVCGGSHHQLLNSYTTIYKEEMMDVEQLKTTLDKVLEKTPNIMALVLAQYEVITKIITDTEHYREMTEETEAPA